MELDRTHFQHVKEIMVSRSMWFDQPPNWTGTLIKTYSSARLLASIVIIIASCSQVYYYGMSYILNDSAVLVPLGLIAIVINVSTALSFHAILRTTSEFDLLISSFVDKWEKNIISKEMDSSKNLILFLVKLLDFYVFITAIAHVTSISAHYFFGFPSKPVALPLLLDMYMEGNFELRPFLFFNVIISLAYIRLLSAFSSFIAAAFYCMACITTILNLLTQRMERISEAAGVGIDKLATDFDLKDTVGKHANLLNVVDKMMKWFGFPFAFVNAGCTLLFCINAITTKKAVENGEYSSLCIWGTFLISAITICYCLCNLGQQIEQKSEEFLRSVYNLPWYRSSSKTRRSVLNMICQGNRLIKLSFNGLSYLNLATFSDILQTSYSYFTMLTSVE